MQYLLLIYTAEDCGEPKRGTPEFEGYVEEFRTFSREVEEKGVKIGANALENVSTATTVRVRGGKPETTDGPFAETKETLGGYFLLDCKDLDQAIDYAAKIPAAVYGSIEIRPLVGCD